MQYKEVEGGICAPKGFAAAGVHCGIRVNHSEKYDLALIKADVRCAAAGVYTTNKVCGAPIKVDRAHLTDGYAQAIVVNSGNANTCAANGVALAEECCEPVSYTHLDVYKRQVQRNEDLHPAVIIAHHRHKGRGVGEAADLLHLRQMLMSEAQTEK